MFISHMFSPLPHPRPFHICFLFPLPVSPALAVLAVAGVATVVVIVYDCAGCGAQPGTTLSDHGDPSTIHDDYYLTDSDIPGPKYRIPVTETAAGRR